MRVNGGDMSTKKANCSDYCKYTDGIAVCNFLYDINFKINFANKKMLNLTEYSFGEITKLYLSDLFNIENPMDSEFRFDQLEEGDFKTTELIMITKSRKELVCKIDYSRINPDCISVFVADTSSCKSARNELDIALAKVNHAKQIGSIGSYEYDYNTKIITASQETIDALGLNLSKQNYKLKEFIENVEDKESYEKTFLSLTDNISPYTMEYDVKFPDGTKKTIYDHAYPVIDENKKPIKALGYIKDMTKWRVVEKKLEYERDIFWRYLNLVGSLIVTLDIDGNVVFINKKGSEILNYPEEEIVGKNWIENFVPEDSKSEIRKIRNLILTIGIGDRDYREGRIISSDGDVRWIYWSNSVLYDENGEVSGTLSSGDDITEIKKKEQDLIISERRLNAAEKIAEIGNWERVFPDGNFKFSDGFYEIIGYDKDEIGSGFESFMALVHDDDKDRFLSEVKKAQKNGGKHVTECRLYRKDGQVIYVSLNFNITLDTNGQPLMSAGVIRNLTELKQKEMTLIESGKRLKDSEAMSHTGHWVRDLKTGNYIFSDEMYRIFGLSRRIKLISADLLHERFHPDDKDNIIVYSENCLKKGKDYKFSGRLMLSDKKIKHIKASVKIIKDKNGVPVSAKGVMSDVTETMLYEQELIRNQLQLEKAEEIAQVGSWVQDLATDEYVCSEGFLKICGIESVEEYKDYNSVIGITHPDDLDNIERIIAESIKSGSDFEFENRIIRPDGDIRYVRSKGTYIKNDNGVPIKSMGTLLDITEYKENEKKLLITQNRLMLAEKIAHIGHWERNYINGESFWSDEVYRILDVEPQSFVASEAEYIKFIHPDDYENFTNSSIKAINGEIAYDIESRIVTKDGELKFIRIIGNRILDGEKLVRTFGTVHDITSIKLSEAELIKKTITLENAEAIAHIGHWERDFRNDSMYWSDEIFRIMGYEPGSFEVVPNKDRDFIQPDDWMKLNEAYMKTRLEGVPLEIDVRAYKRDNTEIILKIKGGVTNPESNGLVISGTIEDITEIKKHYDEIEYMNYHDPLTGLYNRRYFDEQFSEMDNQDFYPISLIVADVNGLKMINDTMGHSDGDEILKTTARILEMARDEGDVLARIGGDDFAILMPRTIKSQAELVVNEIHEQIQKETGGPELSISMGLAVKFDDSHRKEDVIKEAEDNMYTNKLYEKSSKRGDLLRLIMDTLYERSSREELHSERVSKYCGELGKALKLPKHKINELIALGLLHDIGKISVRDSVLNKPGSLNEEEWKEIKKHPETGYRVLSKAPGMQEASKYILAHHERWDGKGYPNGIGTYNIPLQARLIAIADAFDAMRSKRPYRDPLPLDIAVAEIKKGAGSQFDPELAKVFVVEVLHKAW